MNPTEITLFEELTEEWYEDFFGIGLSSSNIRNVQTRVHVTDQNVGSSANTVVYDQTIVYSVSEGTLSAKDYLILPYLDDQSNRAYAQSLSREIDAFRLLDFPIRLPEIIVDDEKPAFNNTTGKIVGDVVGAVALLLTLIHDGGIMVVRLRSQFQVQLQLQLHPLTLTLFCSMKVLVATRSNPPSQKISLILATQLILIFRPTKIKQETILSDERKIKNNAQASGAENFWEALYPHADMVNVRGKNRWQVLRKSSSDWYSRALK